MKKFIQNKLKDQKGLTLIELLAVIVIIAIIAAIAIPAIGNLIENSRNGAVKSDFQNALASANIYFTDNPSETTVTLDKLKTGYLDDAGSITAVTITKVPNGSNTIYGTATAGNAEAVTHTVGTAEKPFTNAKLSAVKNSAFKGTIVAP